MSRMSKDTTQNFLLRVKHNSEPISLNMFEYEASIYYLLQLEILVHH
jgi:hypothetical protein